MARFTGGWIKLHRKMLENDLGSNANLLAIWVTLLLWANRQTTTVRIKGQPEKIPPGTVVLGIRELAAQLDISKDAVYRWLKYLEKRDTIRITSDTRGTLVSICNWDEYQSSEEILRHQPDTFCDTSEDTAETPPRHRPTPNGEEKKERRKERKNKKAGFELEYSSIFVNLWELYGKVGDKKKAFETFEKLEKTEGFQVESLKTAITTYYARKEEWRAAQHFTTFLNGDWRQYLEPLPPMTQTQKSNGVHPATKEQKRAQTNDDLFSAALARMGVPANDTTS